MKKLLGVCLLLVLTFIVFAPAQASQPTKDESASAEVAKNLRKELEQISSKTIIDDYYVSLLEKYEQHAKQGKVFDEGFFNTARKRIYTDYARAAIEAAEGAIALKIHSISDEMHKRVSTYVTVYKKYSELVGTFDKKKYADLLTKLGEKKKE